MSQPALQEQVITLANKKATSTLQWFASKGTVYEPRYNIEVTPLINGVRAFGALEDALKNAKHSIDIICWGFDPSLRLSGPKGEKRYGEILEECAQRGVKVRILIWYSFMADSFPLFVDESLPGYDRRNDKYKYLHVPYSHQEQETRIDQRLYTKHLEKLEQAYQEYKDAVKRWYNNDIDSVKKSSSQFFKRAKEQNVDTAKWKTDQLKKDLEKKKSAYETLYNQAYTEHNGSPYLQNDDRRFSEYWYHRAKNNQISNLYFDTRDMKHYNLVSQSINDSEEPSASLMQSAAMVGFATHHQKMVLVDYEQPASALGFVMGHNMQKNYYDSDAHHYDSERERYLGFRPWQDMSTRVRGSVLYDLNENFATAWDKHYGEGSLVSQRAHLKAAHFQIEHNHPPLDQRFRVMCPQAQICRTQPMYKDKSILEVYQHALGNTTDFIYSENQYFRYSTFAKQVKALAQKRAAKGANPLYWFVVTNKPNSGGEAGNTYRMLKELGQQEKLPQIDRDVRQHLKELHQQKAAMEKRYGLKPTDPEPELKVTTVGEGNSRHYLNWQEYKDKLDKIEDLERGFPSEAAAFEEQKALVDELDVEKPEDAFALFNTEGLNVHIAVLNASTPSLPALYTQIYVHSKLLVVDDIFFTLGSANINKRSMEVDSEISIATPTPKLASYYRKHLWKQHTTRIRHSSLANYDDWEELMEKNWKNMFQGKPLKGTLCHFYDPDTPFAAEQD